MKMQKEVSMSYFCVFYRISPCYNSSTCSQKDKTPLDFAGRGGVSFCAVKCHEGGFCPMAMFHFFL